MAQLSASRHNGASTAKACHTAGPVSRPAARTGMGMVAAPVVMPQVARELFGADPLSEEFLTRYAEQLRRIVARLAAP